MKKELTKKFGFKFAVRNENSDYSTVIRYYSSDFSQLIHQAIRAELIALVGEGNFNLEWRAL